jgi:hypothetical protein
MARTLARKLISLRNGPGELHQFLQDYRAEIQRTSSSEKGHVYWSAPAKMWILVMKKGQNAQVTFHAADDCPCQII